MDRPLRLSRRRPTAVRVDGNGDASRDVRRRTGHELSPRRRSRHSPGGNSLSQDGPGRPLRPAEHDQRGLRLPRSLSFSRSPSGVTSAPRTLISSVPISCFAIRRLQHLQVQGRNLAKLERAHERARDQVVCRQVVHSLCQPVQLVCAGETVEQVRSQQRRVRVVDQTTGRSRWAPGGSWGFRGRSR